MPSELLDLKVGMVLKGRVLPEPIRVASVEEVGSARRIEGEGLASGKWHQFVLSESDLKWITTLPSSAPLHAKDVQTAGDSLSSSGSQKYSGKLVHCGTAIHETFIILDHYVKSGGDWDAVRGAVLQRNLLGKGSTERARQVAEAVRRRFILAPFWLPSPPYIAWVDRLPFSDRAKGQVVLAYIAAEDQLFHDVLSGLVAGLRDGTAAPRKTEIHQYVRELLESISPPVFWSASMEIRWAQGFLAVLRQVGMVSGFNPGVFHIPNIRLEAFSFLFLWLYEKLDSARRTLKHNVFDPFFLEDEQFLKLLEEGRHRGWWGYTGGFGMIEMKPKPPSLEDWLHDLESR